MPRQARTKPDAGTGSGQATPYEDHHFSIVGPEPSSTNSLIPKSLIAENTWLRNFNPNSIRLVCDERRGPLNALVVLIFQYFPESRAARSSYCGFSSRMKPAEHHC